MKLVAWLSYLALVPYLICALVLVGSNYFLLKQTCSIAFIIIQLNSKVRMLLKGKKQGIELGRISIRIRVTNQT